MNALAKAAVPLAVHEAVLAWLSMTLGLPGSSAQWRGAPVLIHSGHADGRARQQCNPMWTPTWLGAWLGRCPRAGLTATTGSAVEFAGFLFPIALGSTRLAIRQPVITLLLEHLVLPLAALGANQFRTLRHIPGMARALWGQVLIPGHDYQI